MCLACLGERYPGDRCEAGDDVPPQEIVSKDQAVQRLLTIRGVCVVARGGLAAVMARRLIRAGATRMILWQSIQRNELTLLKVT